MLEAALHCPTGDDVLGEDPTVLELESHVAGLFGKKAGLFVPTGTSCVPWHYLLQHFLLLVDDVDF